MPKEIYILCAARFVVVIIDAALEKEKQKIILHELGKFFFFPSLSFAE